MNRQTFFVLGAMMACTPILHANGDLNKTTSHLIEVQSVSGREQVILEDIAFMLGDIPWRQDAFGNLVVTLGAPDEAPRKLITVGVDQPGYVVGAIQDNGYLRLKTFDRAPRPALWHSFHRGQKVRIQTEEGPRIGVISIPSVHLMTEESDPWQIPGDEDLFVDVGADNPLEVAQLGIRVLDPVTGNLISTELADGRVAGYAARQKAAAAMLVDLARRLHGNIREGSVTLIWTRYALLGRAGAFFLSEQYKPFDEVWQFSTAFHTSRDADGWQWSQPEQPGHAYFVQGEQADLLVNGHIEPMLNLESMRLAPDWGKAKVTYFGIPVEHPMSPVETIALANLDSLGHDLLEMLAPIRNRKNVLPPPIPPSRSLSSHEQGEFSELKSLLGELIGVAGVSKAEDDVARLVSEKLQGLGELEIDQLGNLILRLGAGEDHVAFVAHLDEVGFYVRAIQDDGSLQLATRGGLLPYLWEGQPARLHLGENQSLPAIIRPHDDYRDRATLQKNEPLTALVGANSREEAEAMGIVTGKTTVTMPKRLAHLSAFRAAGRGCDDRCGSAAMILAAKELAKRELNQRVTLIWSVEEEIGLHGVRALMKEMKDVNRAHPVDTFVSGHSPVDPTHFGQAPLGKGPVLRAMDSAMAASRQDIDSVLRIATGAGIPLQLGITGGATDGTVFFQAGIPNLPIGWPGRYSHSPVEVVDFRDLDNLVQLIIALASE